MEKAVIDMLVRDRQPKSSNDVDPLPSETAPPRFPDARVPEGLVWPPIAGRALLKELEPQAAKAFPLARGAWAATLGLSVYLLTFLTTPGPWGNHEILAYMVGFVMTLLGSGVVGFLRERDGALGASL